MPSRIGCLKVPALEIGTEAGLLAISLSKLGVAEEGVALIWMNLRLIELVQGAGRIRLSAWELLELHTDDEVGPGIAGVGWASHRDLSRWSLVWCFATIIRRAELQTEQTKLLVLAQSHLVIASEARTSRTLGGKEIEAFSATIPCSKTNTENCRPQSCTAKDEGVDWLSRGVAGISYVCTTTCAEGRVGLPLACFTGSNLARTI